MTLRRRLATLVAALGLVALAACETAPATGQQFFTGGLSAGDEAALGREEHPKIVAAFGGVYDDPALAAYVQSLGEDLAAKAERPDLDFTFTLLDSPIVNAFAVPGGYVYVTRGLLALADTEAQLAGVLAHEIGHITGRHTAQRYGQSVLAQVGTLAAAVLLGDTGAQVASSVSELALASYSRDQEYEADLLGVRYLGRSGFSEQAMAGFLAKLQAHSELEAELAGRPGQADQFSFLTTHPRTRDRIEQAIAAADVSQEHPIVDRDGYLNRLDGLLYGDDPREGVIRGREFLHPELGIAWQAPPDFALTNGPSQVVAESRSGGILVFDQAPEAVTGSLERYITGTWGREAGLQGAEPFTVNGLEGATATTRIQGQSGPVDVRLVAIRTDPAGRVYRFLMLSAAGASSRLAPEYRRTIESFRRLSPEEAASIRPLAIRIHEVRPGETVGALAKRTPFTRLAEERFRVLNGLAPGADLTPGQLVKLVQG